jgi:hypothetical protein
MAGERHGMCELAFKKPPSIALTRGIDLSSSALCYVLQHLSVDLQHNVLFLYLQQARSYLKINSVFDPIARAGSFYGRSWKRLRAGKSTV